MPRPSQAQDQALIASGRRLYPQLGCAELSVRRVAQEAGVNPAMVHYHFGSKDGFLRAVLQQAYEDMFRSLSFEARGRGDALARLQACLLAMARFVRMQRATIVRIWADAQAGEPVALEFMRANVPRHLAVLAGLAREAEQAGLLRREPALTRFSFLMGAVIAPLVVAGGARGPGVLPLPLSGALDVQVLSDRAIRKRIRWALAALRKEPA